MTTTLPDFLQPLFGDSRGAVAIFYGVLGALGVLTLVILWQVLGHGPRRGRGLKRAKHRLAQGAWQDALGRVRKLRNLGTPSAAWKKRLGEVEAECLRRAAQLDLESKKYEDALAHFLRVAQILGEPEVRAKSVVQSAMLEEVRRLFSVTSLGDSKPVHELIARVLLVQSPCREAYFWQAMSFLRDRELERAMEALQTARGGKESGVRGQESPVSSRKLEVGSQELSVSGQTQLSPDSCLLTPGATYIDPPLYLGALLLRQGLAKDSLKYLAEANRLSGTCPVVTLQLGAAMIAAGGDTQLAVRALQRALGPRGLAQWQQEPRQAWVEGFPEERSYVRKLASVYPFVCPVWGGDLNILVQQGNLALAQGFYKMAAYPESADLFGKVLQNGAPSLTVLRGLGLSLAHLGKYDDAFKHLRIAHEMEEPKDRVTAGYLALCGAKGTPTEPEDKARNIRWAINLVTRFNAPGDSEWVALINALFADAREDKVTLGLDDQLYLCEHLWSVNAADPQAALAYHHLQATYPQAVRPEYAWLYCRAALEHKIKGTHALELFQRTFSDPEPARAFFAEKQWDWGELEFAYLECAAATDPGHFPAVLGPIYPAVGEDMLLARSQAEEQGGQHEAALQTAAVLHQLAPQSPRACDRLAFLHQRSGSLDRAAQLLESWSSHHPRDPRPLVRLAVLLYQGGLKAESQVNLRAALALCAGPRRARIAFVGARLTLRDALSNATPENNGASGLDDRALGMAEELLNQCVRDDPNHGDALWCLAAVRWLRGDMAGLAQQAPAMNRAETLDVRFHFLAAVCRLAARDFPAVLVTCARMTAVQPPLSSATESRTVDVAPGPRLSWPVENAYLAGLAHLGLGHHAAAAQALATAAASRESPSATHAQALLGSIGFTDNDHQQAATWWQMVDPKKRFAWKLGETLGQTVFLTALEAYELGSFEQAAEKLRAAGKLGCRDRRLGALLVTSLFKAGQAMIYQTDESRQ